MEPKRVFISLTHADADFGNWLAHRIEEMGHQVDIMSDWRAGEDFIDRMLAASARADHTLALCTDAYFASPYAMMEFKAGLIREAAHIRALQGQGDQADAAQTARRALIPVRMDASRPPDLFGARIAINLIGPDGEPVTPEECVEKVRAALAQNRPERPEGAYLGAHAQPIPADETRYVTVLGCDIIAYSPKPGHEQRTAKQFLTNLLRDAGFEDPTKDGWAGAGDGGYAVLSGELGRAYRLLLTLYPSVAESKDVLQLRYALHSGLATPMKDVHGVVEWQGDAINETARLLHGMSKRHTGQIVISDKYWRELERELAPDGRKAVRLADVIDRHEGAHARHNLITGGDYGVQPFCEELFVEGRTVSAPPTDSLDNLPPLPVHALVDLPEAIAALDTALTGGAATLSQTIRGLGGVGKTTLAIAYARRPETAARFPCRWWIDAERGTDAGLAGLAVALGIVNTETPEAQAVVAARRWLKAPTRPALIIYDNAEESTFDAALLP